MSQLCASCGAASANDAAFCASCGRALKPKIAAKSLKSAANKGRWSVPFMAIAIVLVVVVLYFWLFIADDLKQGADMPATEAGEVSNPDAQIFFAITDANLGDVTTAPLSMLCAWLKDCGCRTAIWTMMCARCSVSSKPRSRP